MIDRLPVSLIINFMFLGGVILVVAVASLAEQLPI